MAERRMDPAEEKEKSQSTRPENWPGIPGRSREHEASPDSPGPKKGNAEVTEAQRELERKP